MISELDLIKRIRTQLSPLGQQGGAPAPLIDTNLIQGIGDDCAVLANREAESLSLVTTDTLVEGVHFDLSWHPPELLGRKAVAVNVSDIAAMGGRPRFALLSLAVPAAFKPEALDVFLGGFMAALASHRVTLIGGDTVRSEQGLVLSVTVLGEVERGQVVYRSGARPGDQIWVSGELGQAAAGLEICRQRQAALHETYPELVAAHLNPTPEMALGQALARAGCVSAMIDMSDGLASDLAHVCEESMVGAVIYADRLPISAATRQTAQTLGQAPLQLALTGGEDYRLLFTAPPTANNTIRGLASQAAHGQLFPIGEIRTGQGVLLATAGGQTSRIDFQGYDHFA